MKDKFYYSDGSILDHHSFNKVLHRIDGPAVECANGHKEWYVDGKLHRTEGPAIIFSIGKCRWFIEDIQYSEQEFQQMVSEAKALSLELRLTDIRKWVRDLK